MKFSQVNIHELIEEHGHYIYRQIIAISTTVNLLGYNSNVGQNGFGMETEDVGGMYGRGLHVFLV
jgi:hypothetical protein